MASAGATGEDTNVVPESRFDVAFLPTNLRRRNLLQHSIHYNANKWVATIARPHDSTTRSHDSNAASFKFASEKEAKRFVKSYAPPKMVSVSEQSECQICVHPFDQRRYRPYNCRNCGSCVCERCSLRWGRKMIPKTYSTSSHQAVTVRVCLHCDWLSNAFCMALLQGKFQEAVMLYETGNVNLRSSFANINRESMFPVHCAVIGGNFTLFKWLVETHACPVAIRRGKDGKMLSIRTSSNRSLIDLAMSGKAKANRNLDILRYLIVDKNMSVEDTSNPALPLRILDMMLRDGFQRQPTSTEARDDMEVDPIQHLVESASEEECSVATTMEDACTFCLEQPKNCALVPCGHQLCCSDCASKFATCPICKVDCTVLVLFR